MLLLLGFAFLAGLVTVAAPCIWPLLPIVLASAFGGGRAKPLGVAAGIAVVFTVVTLLLGSVIRAFPLAPDVLRWVAVAVIGGLGLTLAVPVISVQLEGWVSRLAGRFAPAPTSGQPERATTGSTGSFWGGFGVGAALALVWTPCAGPILAAIATLAATQPISSALVAVTAAFALGIAVPLGLVALAGQRFSVRLRAANRWTGRIQQAFGIILVVTAAAVATGADKSLQRWFLDVFPGYTNFVLQLDGGDAVERQLDALRR